MALPILAAEHLKFQRASQGVAMSSAAAPVPERSKSSYARLLTAAANCKSSDGATKALHERFARFHSGHECNAQHVERTINGLSRAKKLLDSAVQWRDPAIGPNRERLTPTCMARGEQWRLVMSFAAFENFVRKLLNSTEPGLPRKHIVAFVSALPLPPFPPMAPPKRELKQVRLWLEMSRDDSSGFLEQSMGMRKQGSLSLESWLLNGNAVSDWTDGLLLAQTLRHATAHGALSPNKAVQLGLRPAMQRLPFDVKTVIDCALQELLPG